MLAVSVFLACFGSAVGGFALCWTIKPQTKEVSGSVRGLRGRFVKKDQ